MKLKPLVLLALLPLAHPILAGEVSGCTAAAKGLLVTKPGQLLSVVQARESCTAIFLMYREGKRPRRMTVNFRRSPDESAGIRWETVGPAKILPVAGREPSSR